MVVESLSQEVTKRSLLYLVSYIEIGDNHYLLEINRNSLIAGMLKLR